ncbi:MAG TPA: hypothetical protein VLZ77_02580 [Acidimicrobiales bacterium]|nr:hypothetical protein [Acidimicrobiales bacterium]
MLLEAPEGAEAGRLWGILDGGGFRVSWCPGPEGPPAAWCPVMGGRRCALVEEADVVVSALGLSAGSCRQVLEGITRLHPDAGVIVEASPADAAACGALLEGCTVLPRPLPARALLEAAGAVCVRRRGRGAGP